MRRAFAHLTMPEIYKGFIILRHGAPIRVEFLNARVQNVGLQGELSLRDHVGYHPQPDSFVMNLRDNFVGFSCLYSHADRSAHH